jgi:molybdopterin converting factor small subunit
VALPNLSTLRLNLGQGIENLGTALGLPEWGRSESVAGRNTALTGQTPQSYSAMYPSYPSSSQGQYSTTGIRPTNFGQVLGTVDASRAPNPAFNAPQATPVTTGTGGTGDNTQGGGINLDALYTDAFKNLDSQLGSLADQRQTQEQMVQNRYQQGYNTLSDQYSSTKGQIEDQRAKTLNELSDALRQQWQTGNVMLGVRGASDSSAAQQYSYALTRMGTRQRAEVMGEVDNRLTDLKKTYDTNVQNLELEKNNQLMQVSNWFNEAQGQIRNMEAGLQKEKSEQALNIALQMFSQVQQDAQNRKSILDQWAANNAKTLTELQSQLASNAQNLPTFQGIDGQISGGGNGTANLFGFRNTDEQNNRMLI